MFNRETSKPLVDLAPEQRSTIYRLLCQFNLENYQQYVEEIILSHGDLPLLLNLIACIFEEGQKDIRERLLQLENLKLTGLGGKR